MDNENYDELEQYYYIDGKYIKQKEGKYFSLIGKFVIDFSRLENEINLAIADIMFDDDHSFGFSFIAELTFAQKVKFLYQRCMLIETHIDKDNINCLKKLKEGFESVNNFRNSLIHANWESLTKEGFVHTKITLDAEYGCIKFKKIKLTPQIIRQKIKTINKLIVLIGKYKEDLFQRI